MFVQISRFFVAACITAALAACSSSDPADAAQPRAATAPQPVTAPYLQSPALVAAAAPAAPVAAEPARVTESERRAEELRLVDDEQSYSIELNRRSREQAERAQRSALALRAGVVQGPGCEGTEGYAAQECERSLM